jgi:N-acetylmuramoyl-L-alanine amidase
MIVGPNRPANRYWRSLGLLVLMTVLVNATSATAWAQASSSAKSAGLPFGLSAFFSTTNTPAKTDKRTRITIDLHRKSPFEVFSLKNPNRVIIELPQVGMRLPRLRRAQATGLVRNLRAGHSAPGRSRIVIDVSEPVVVEKTRIKTIPGRRGAQLEVVMVPFKATSRRTRTALSKRPAYSLGGPVLSNQPPVPRRATKRHRDVYKPLIVIDPGHGGKDSGAQKFGVDEKNVVLAFSKTLRDRLLKTRRYRVKMTRSKDVFIPLGERRDFAEENNAALFIAVHADYAGTNARGATIYSLRRGVARKLRRSAAEDAARNALSKGLMKYVVAKSDDLRAVRGILGDLAQREVHVNLERTNVFTKLAIAQMGATTTMRSKPHQEAAFKVLKTAKVPSVLIELAYVSNRRDSARLQSQRWRNNVSRSLVTAVDKYFAHKLSQIAQ